MLTITALLFGCSNLLVGKHASGTGSPQIAYTSDAGFQYGGMGLYPAANHTPGTRRQIYDEDSGAYAGEIPEAAHTYNAVAYHGGMNEHQLAISETTFGGLASLGGQGGLIDYGTLMDLALQRCTTAREAIRFIDAILREHGYASSGESISIADTEEAWLMELVSKGKGQKGAVWVAMRVPDDGVCAHANQARITTWPRDDPGSAMWANDTVSFAVSRGLYPADADPLAFSFSDAFDPVDFAGARLCDARAYNMLAQVAADPAFAPSHLDYAQGRNLTNRMPLFVTAKGGKGAVTRNTTSWLMRTRFAGTWFDERADVGAGPFHAEFRQSPSLWSSGGAHYTNERTVGVQYNAFHFVATPRADVPAPVGGVLWWGADDQSFAARFPAYAASAAIPETWREGPTQNRTVFKLRSSHWAFTAVAHLAYSRWSAVHPIVQQRIVDTERRYAADLAAMDATALQLLETEGAESARAALTNFTVAHGDALVDEWVALFGELFVRFSDGFDASAIPRAPPVPGAPPYTPGGTATVDIKSVGYDDAWYARIAKDAPEHYRVPDSGTGALLLNPALSTDRLKFIM